MTTAECKTKIKEMLPAVAKYLEEETDRLMRSGAVDLEKEPPDQYGVAKSLLIVALENCSKQYYHKIFAKHVRNLRHF